VGHSWGSYLGTLLVLKHPDRFYAFVGVGQVVDQEREDSLQAAFIRKEALARGVPEALQDLEALGTAAHEKWLFRFGGELAGATGWLPLVWTGVLAPEYSFRDVLRVAAGSQVSSRHMVYDVLEGPLGDHVESYPVPVFFFQGRTDWTTPSPLVEEYYQRILAPSKELVWFENSSHFPFFEEPDRFAQEMRRVKALVEDEKGGT
jgi:pimeloyl-ACP methyl ester carboxylesterase